MKTIGIIGFGNMGSAIAERIKSKYKVFVFDKDQNKTRNLSKINVEISCRDLIDKVDTIILAVKPQDFDNLLGEIKNFIKDKLVISIAAGITTNYIENKLGNVRVIRTMPNMPARIGKGMTCLCRGRYANEDDLDFSKLLFDNLGKTLILNNEDLIDVATAISGSGPGYFFDLIDKTRIDINNKNDIENFINELTEVAKSIGFSDSQAIILAESTTQGSLDLIKNSNLSPSELVKQVASKGGTTEAALDVLHRGGSLKEAVQAALRRAKELSKK